MPTITFWPNKIKPGESDALFSQVDFYASLISLVGFEGNKAPDSENMLPVLTGESKNGRKQMIEEAFTMSLRLEDWKYIAPFAGITPDWLRNKDVATGLQSDPQLFNLKDDPAESHNLADQYPDNVDKLAKMLTKIMANK